MLCPEVWNFEQSSCSSQIKEGSLDEEAALWRNVVDLHYFNHFVSVTLPETALVPCEIRESLLSDGDYYKVLSLPLNELINHDFLTAFVKKGRIFALSVQTCLDVDDCVALLPTGQLILSLTKDTYQQLGLQGKPSSFCGKQPNRFVVNVSLKEDSFAPGKKNYERVKWCFENRLDLTFNFIIAWEPPGDSICPSSVANFLTVQGFDVKVCHPRLSQRSQKHILVPSPVSEDCPDGCNMEEFTEWLGLISLNRKFVVQEDSKILGQDGVQTGQVQVLNWSGLFTPQQLHHLINEIRLYVDCRTSSRIPWCAVSVLGFEDCPVSWGTKEHAFHSEGTNMYTMIIKPGNKCTLQTTLSSTKKLK